MVQDIWEKYAKVLVDYSTDVKKGELVIIRATSPVAEPLVKAVYKRVLEKGANPLLRTSICDLSDMYIKHATDEQLDFVDPISKMEYEIVDKYISIGAPLNVKNLARADKSKLARRSKATKELSELLLNRTAEGKASWVIADVPTHGLAQEAKMSIDEYTDFLINACYLDLDNPVEKLLEIDKEQKRLCEYLDSVKKVRFVGEKTDVTFSTEGRKWISCSGKHNYPDGEVFTSPVEDSANGEIYFDFPAIYRGNDAHKIHIKLENGKVVSATAEKGEEFLKSMLNLDEGASFVGEIAIGTNERIQDVTGSILFDEKIGGSIHVAFGASYPETGGKNLSGLHWDIIKNMKGVNGAPGGEIYADDTLIYKDGKFLI